MPGNRAPTGMASLPLCQGTRALSRQFRKKSWQRPGRRRALWDAATRGRPYALVLLDARMPDTDGLALAAEIRKRAELSATRIILLSSGDRPGDWDRVR